MIHPPGHHLAELNFGVLRHDWDDPRVADFAEALDRVNAVAHRSPGFVWQMPEDDMDAAQNDPQGALGGNPRTASSLSVWEDADSLGQFVFETVHVQFYRRRAEWFDRETGGKLVLWWVPVGHRPSVAEGMERFRDLAAHGQSDRAFGWSRLSEAGLWHPKTCAAE